MKQLYWLARVVREAGRQSEFDHDSLNRSRGKQTLFKQQSSQVLEALRENALYPEHRVMELTPNVVLQLHRDLFQFAPGGGGHWKSTDNDIMERRSDGESVVRFKPVPAHLTDLPDFFVPVVTGE